MGLWAVRGSLQGQVREECMCTCVCKAIQGVEYMQA